MDSVFKKMGFLILALLLLNFNLSALEKGKEFDILQEPFEMQNSVIEIFYYGCQHCYIHHKTDTLGKIKIKLPHVKYYALPFTFNSNDIGLREIYAYAQVQDDDNNISVTDEKSWVRKLNDRYFSLVFSSNKSNKKDGLNDEELVQAGLQILGITKQEIREFVQSEKAKKVLALYEKVHQTAKIYGGVPIFIINGKFKLNIEEINSLDDMIKISDELINIK
ncbi:hypothetical protein [Campylobacter sp. CCS1377]|uniref:Thiol:disulfide interchange protein n=1 Tax=Campylobacter sp. CCS1377 TaxID=3158229 RepID=A0AAU7E5H9_9BACT|nr:hypothetical protein [Campylobacter jejuni]